MSKNLSEKVQNALEEFKQELKDSKSTNKRGSGWKQLDFDMLEIAKSLVNDGGLILSIVDNNARTSIPYLHVFIDNEIENSLIITPVDARSRGTEIVVYEYYSFVNSNYYGSGNKNLTVVCNSVAEVLETVDNFKSGNTSEYAIAPRADFIETLLRVERISGKEDCSKISGKTIVGYYEAVLQNKQDAQ